MQVYVHIHILFYQIYIYLRKYELNTAFLIENVTFDS